MWGKVVLSCPEWVSERPAVVSVREREHTACVCGADVCVYEVLSGWSEHQRERGWMDVQRTWPPFLKTPAVSVEVSMAVEELVCVLSLSSCVVVVVVVGFLVV